MKAVLLKPSTPVAKDETSASRAVLSLRQWRYFLGSIALGLGFLRVWLGRTAWHGIDGISYLDVGDAYMRGDWKTAINGLWSPLYPLFLGGALKIVKPSAQWEVPLVHLVGFMIYAGTLVCFDFLWNEFGQVLRERTIAHLDSWTTFTERGWLLLGYCIFLWVSLQIIGVAEESPDMLVAVFVYLASALLLRISRNSARPRTFAALGLVLGVGYLAKTVMFPLSFVFLAVATFVTYRKRQSLAPPLMALLVFLLTASPLLVALSRAKGRFTFGDSGTVNYIWHVDEVPWMYWHGTYAGSGAPIHPPRLIFAKPEVYEYATPFVATFPIWYDPSYWYDGMRPHFDLRKQVHALVEAVGIYHGLFVQPRGVLLAISLGLLLLGGSVRDLAERLDVFLPVIAAFGAYALVHVESRYLGPFVLVFWGGVLCQVRLPDGELANRLLRLSVLAIVIIYSMGLAGGVVGAMAAEKDRAAAMNEDLQAARGLREAGFRPGDPVAAVNGISSAGWARLAKLRIVADSPDDAAFWSQEPSTRSNALAAFATTGAKAIVAWSVPPSGQTEGWTRIGQTNYYIHPLVRLAELRNAH